MKKRQNNYKILPANCLNVLNERNKSFPDEFTFNFEGNNYNFRVNKNFDEQTDIYTNDFNNTEKILKFHHHSSSSNQIVLYFIHEISI